MSILEEKNIVQCQCCGNRDGSLIVERDGGYVCKCCGVWYKKNPTEAEFREQMWVMQGYSQLRSYRFGDARDTFENILAEHPNSINALWGLILSRYGVVYIKGFYKGVVEPIYCFPNYERMKRRYVQNEPEYEQIMGLLKGDNTLRFEYEKKAEKIDDALDEFKKFKETTDRDVFICVKISAATTRHPELTGRTKDYEFALDVYNELTRRGVNAFYSFITLENDVKSDEKIWRNLVKSKKMLLIGSNEEYLESPWVKSEWKRWLHLRREDDLYVCVLHESDESPFDILPQEISDLEPQIYTQDMRDRLINHICKGLGVESEDESAAALEAAKRERERKEAAAAQQERLRREAEAVEYTRKRREAEEAEQERKRKEAAQAKQNGKIVYSDGREEVLEYGITEIQDDAYFEEEEIVSVVLPTSVTSIGRSAFDGCAELKSVTVPESVTSIGNSAFAYCYELTDITLPDSVTFIDRTAFSNCRSLKDIAIPKGVTSIEYGTFNECGSLSSVTIPSSVTSIGAYAFYECGSLTDIHYDGSKTQWQKISVGADNDALVRAEGHFSAPKSAKSARSTSQSTKTSRSASQSTKTSRSASQSTKTTRSAPQSVKPVQSAPKSGKLIYSDGRAEALDHDLAQLKEKDKSKRMDIVGIVLPDGLTEISRYAFNECQNLESIEIPSGITAIGEYAFYNCKKLKEIKIPSGVKTIGEHAFYNCQSLKEITVPDGVSSIGEKSFSYCLALTGIKLPGSLTAISAYTFNACPFLKSVVIPEGVTKIGEGAFESCENLVSAELPESVTEIGELAFGYCTALESIEIPDGVSTIEASTFTWCKSLASVTLSSGLRTIGASAFNVCKGLVSIKIPASVTEIGECAFDICTNITDIYYEGSKYDWARIDIGKGNAKLNGLFGRAKIHFNSI